MSGGAVCEKLAGLILLAGLVAGTGCGSDWEYGPSEAETANPEVAATTGAVTAADGATTTAGATTAGFPAEIDTKIHWLHTDVSGWAQTAALSASIGGDTINLSYNQAKVWPAVDGVNANPWVFVKWTDGQWYAATWEYLRSGQTSKPKAVLSGAMGDHIKVAPLSSWRPHSGERIGLMVSGLARSNLRNVKERSNVVMVTWP